MGFFDKLFGKKQDDAAAADDTTVMDTPTVPAAERVVPDMPTGEMPVDSTVSTPDMPAEEPVAPEAPAPEMTEETPGM